MVPLKGETVAVLRAANENTDNPVLPPRFKAAIWVSPKGSGRRFLAVRIGTDAEGRGSRWSHRQEDDLDPEKAQSLEAPEKHPDPPLQGRERGSGP